MNQSIVQPSLPPDLMAWVHRLAFESPPLAALSADQLEQLAHSVLWANLGDELKRLADLARIDYPRERELFLQNSSPTKSPWTRQAYERGLTTLEAWCQTHGLAVPAMTVRDADEYVYSLRNTVRAPASVRLDAAAAGAFFSFLERRHEFIRHPFRGSRARPKAIPVRWPLVPSGEQMSTIIQAAPPALRAALVCLSSRGLRVGALPTLVIRGRRFTGWSKGKRIAGRLPDVALEAIREANLDPKRPFATLSSRLLSGRVRHHCRKLHRAGVLPETFSSHDLRHYFAVSEYTRNKDLYRLKVLLGHSIISTTERYLRSIQVLD